MRNIYILYDGVNAVKNASFHGGGTFTRWLTKAMAKRLGGSKEWKLHILWPKGRLPETLDERSIYESEQYCIDETDDAYSFPFDGSGDVLLVPILESCHVDLAKIKRSNPSLRIKVVIHGMRNVDLARYDCFQKYYHSWYRPIPGIGFVSYIRQLRLKKKEIRLIRSACLVADSVFTVSNCSMQMILRYGKPRKIKYYHQSSFIEHDAVRPKSDCTERFALIVSINRNEKNFVRTLFAYLSFLKETGSDLKLYAVGLTAPFEKNLKKVFANEWDSVKENVRFFGYINTQDLALLYEQCSFVLYPSKSEGYGLPLLDAAENSKPVVAGRETAIPEVLGSAAFYVDPYDMESIKAGLLFFDKQQNLTAYAKRIVERRNVMHLLQALDANNLIEDILE